MKTISPRRFEDGTYTYIDGQLHKRCTGPAHDETTYLPANSKYFYLRGSQGRKGELTSRCRLCSNWQKLKVKSQMNGWIPLSEARPFYLEAANRVGAMELAKRAGVNYISVTNVLRGRGTYVQRRTLRKIMLELVSIRRKNEYSINGLSAWRVTARDGVDRCSGCGGPVETYVEGCTTCTWRKNGIDARRRAGALTRRKR